MFFYSNDMIYFMFYEDRININKVVEVKLSVSWPTIRSIDGPLKITVDRYPFTRRILFPIVLFWTSLLIITYGKCSFLTINDTQGKISLNFRAIKSCVSFVFEAWAYRERFQLFVPDHSHECSMSGQECWTVWSD